MALLIKQITGDNDKANLMAHALAQLGGNSAVAGTAGAFSGELAGKNAVENNGLAHELRHDGSDVKRQFEKL